MYFGLSVLNDIPNIFLLFLQILSVSSQVWPLCSDPQGDPHRLPLHQPGQGQEEQAGGHGGVLSGPQPQQLLHQFSQLGGLLRGWTTEPSWTGKTTAASFDYAPFVRTVGVLVRGIVWHVGKFAYLLCCQELDEKIDTAVMTIWSTWTYWRSYRHHEVVRKPAETPGSYCPPPRNSPTHNPPHNALSVV